MAAILLAGTLVGLVIVAGAWAGSKAFEFLGGDDD